MDGAPNQLGPANIITTVSNVPGNVKTITQFQQQGSPLRVDNEFSAYLSLVVQNWSQATRYVRLYHIITTNTPQILPRLQNIDLGEAGKFLLEKIPLVEDDICSGSSLLYTDEDNYWVQGVIDRGNSKESLIYRKTEPVKLLNPGGYPITYCYTNGDLKLDTVKSNLPGRPVGDDCLRLLDIRNVGQRLPEGVTVKLYFRKVGQSTSSLHELVFTSEISEGVINVSKNFLLEVYDPKDYQMNKQGSFTDSVLTYNQAAVFVKQQGTSDSNNFEISIIQNVQDEAKLLYPTQELCT